MGFELIGQVDKYFRGVFLETFPQLPKDTSPQLVEKLPKARSAPPHAHVPCHMPLFTEATGPVERGCLNLKGADPMSQKGDQKILGPTHKGVGRNLIDRTG